MDDACDFEDFFRAERDSLVRFCWGLAVDRERAADLALEAMTRAWRDWAVLGANGSNPAAWRCGGVHREVHLQRGRGALAAALGVQAKAESVGVRSDCEGDGAVHHGDVAGAGGGDRGGRRHG